MKKYIYIILATAMMWSCSGPQKYLKKGQYDTATRKAVQKIRKNPTKAKNIDILAEAYPKANSINLDRIKFLRQEGRPDVWDEIFENYSRLKDRQDMVKTVYPFQHPTRKINFEFVDYDNEVINAKKNAAEYFYAHAKTLMKDGGKAGARDAYYEFRKVKSYYSSYQDVDQLMEQARQQGMSHALVKVENGSHIKLPTDFKTDLIKNDYGRINTEWVEYDAEQRNGIDYDYSVIVNIKLIDVSPEGIKEESFNETKVVDDGFQYALDANGNVMKDTLGNDIKIPKTKTISVLVVKTLMHKAVHIEGNVDYINNFTGKVLRTVPIAADNFFEHAFAIANGDFTALTPESKKLIGIKPIPFPPDFDMIWAAGDILKKVAYDAMQNNRRVLN